MAGPLESDTILMVQMIKEGLIESPPLIQLCHGIPYGAPADLLTLLAMVQQLFVVGRGNVGMGGVVRDAALRRSAIAAVARGAAAAVMGFAPSGLPGPAGNRETFVWLAEAGRPGAIEDVDAALAEVDV